MRKNTVSQRLNIVKGQVNGLIDLIEAEKDCRKITEQFYATNTALKKAMELYFNENMTTCLESINPKKKTTIEFLLQEIIKNK
ncbi:MAG: metal-sensitive transcriptional regulator [Patescibacteria group bacterium]|nr:metal-sensitive transcriptional regulator [Patescibacteria group bacterium]